MTMLFPFSFLGGKKYGMIGSNADLPNLDYEWPGGYIIGMTVTSDKVQQLVELLCKVQSSAPGNRMRMAIYEKTGADSGNLLELSSDIVNYGTMSLEQLSFTVSQSLDASQDYWIAAQSENACYFPYANVVDNNYANIGNPAFGSFPANFSGVATLAVDLQFWGKTEY